MNEKRKFSSHASPISGHSPRRDTGCLLALAGWYKPLPRLPFWGLSSVITRHLETSEKGSSLVSHRVCHSFTQAHRRVSKAKQKTCSLREQRTRAPSILTLSWRIPTSPQDERLLLNHTKTPGFLAPGGEEFNPGPETRLDRSELLCNKVLLKYKGDRESFWHRHQKGAERVPPW